MKTRKCRKGEDPLTLASIGNPCEMRLKNSSAIKKFPVKFAYIKTDVLFTLLLIFYVYECFTCMYICRASDALELELRMVVSCLCERQKLNLDHL